MRPASTEIIRHLDELRHSVSRWQIFDDFVDVCYQTLRMLPRHAERVFSGQGLAPDDEESADVFRRVQQTYAQDGQSTLARAFALVLRMAEDDPYVDPFGTVYEEWELHSNHTGQFFTPRPLCLAMARMTAGSAADEVRERLSRSLEHQPVVGLSRLMGFELSDEVLEYALYEQLHNGGVDYEPIVFNDPACGSGRLLLAAAELLPEWMIRRNLVRFTGQDIDRTCVQMARANTMLYGLNGTGTWLVRKEPDETIRTEPGEQLVLL